MSSNKTKSISKEDVINQLKTIIDPHIGIDIWTLGFIYEINIKDDKNVHILMTLTTPMCPLDGDIKDMIKDALAEIGVENVEVEKTFDPPWTPPEAVRRMMGV